MELLIDSHHGIYIPQIFSQQYPDVIKDKRDLAVLIEGPDNENYWEAWDDTLSLVEFEGGKTIYQDEDLWLLDKGEEFINT